MIYHLDHYQEVFLNNISTSLFDDRAIIAQAETGAGKTVVFSNIAYRFINKSTQNVIIFVNREELLDQTRDTIHKWFGVLAQKIDSKTRIIDSNARVFVVMVETFFKRTIDTNFMNYFKNVGLCIIDEAHIGNFKKVIPFFATSLRIGFSATPISAVKKDPLNKYYKSIVVGPTPQELMDINALNPKRGIVPLREFSPKNINRANLKLKGDEFTEESLNEEFMGNRQINNTIAAYMDKSFGLKTICFNASIEHSLEVTEAMRKAGLNVRHLDGNKNGKWGNEYYRKDCFKWLKYTKNAILCNVGIATTGFDEPSIMNIINNSAMMSITLFRQKRGRAGRPCEFDDGTFKTYANHLDMGDNILGGKHGRWKETVDWAFLFHNPKVPKAGGVAPIKICESCGAINDASARYCKGLKYDWLEDADIECGAEFPIKAASEDLIPKEMVLIDDEIDVQKCINFFKDKQPHFSMYKLYEQIANQAKDKLTSIYLDAKDLRHIVDIALDKVSEWHKLTRNRKFPNFKESVASSMLTELKKAGFTINIEEANEAFDLDA